MDARPLLLGEARQSAGLLWDRLRAMAIASYV